MVYDTRRKSLNLPSLGVQLPQTHSEKAAARNSPLSIATSTSELQFSLKLKRSRDSWPCTNSPRPSKRIYKCPDDINTPPLSPPADVHEFNICEDDEDENMKEEEIKVEDLKSEDVKMEEIKEEDVKPDEIDLDEVKDDIVEAVIVQLQKTGNRPHLVKELAAILSKTVKIVESSANPCAIISSRLSGYLKRPWSASSPCPVGKELETVHPRRTYFYLTTYPHQPIPDPTQLPQRSIITPSISSAESISEDPEQSRCESPEVDLSSEEYDDDDSITPPTPTGSFSVPGRFEHLQRSNRTSSVGLEKDEKEFTQLARGVQKRRFSGESPKKPSDMNDMPSSNISDTPMRSVESDPFFEASRGLPTSNPVGFMNSPAMKPISASKKSWDANVETSNANWMTASGKVDTLDDFDSRSPENVELDELDGLFEDF